MVYTLQRQKTVQRKENEPATLRTIPDTHGMLGGANKNVLPLINAKLFNAM